MGGVGDVQALLARPDGAASEQGDHWSDRCLRFWTDPTPPSLIDPRRTAGEEEEEHQQQGGQEEEEEA